MPSSLMHDERTKVDSLEDFIPLLENLLYSLNEFFILTSLVLKLGSATNIAVETSRRTHLVELGAFGSFCYNAIDLGLVFR